MKPDFSYPVVMAFGAMIYGVCEVVLDYPLIDIGSKHVTWILSS